MVFDHPDANGSVYLSTICEASFGFMILYPYSPPKIRRICGWTFEKTYKRISIPVEMCQPILSESEKETIVIVIVFGQ